MASAASGGAAEQVEQAGELPDSVRGAFVVVLMALAWVHTNPFADLSSVATIEASDGGSWANQIAFSLTGLATAAILHRLGLARLRSVLTRPLVLSALWLGVSVVLSVEPALSLRRAVLLGIAMLAATTILIVPRTVRAFADLLAGTALALLVVCFVSLVLVPDLAMHSILDLREPEHAGSWRGFFIHKNEAGATMAIFAFIGLYAAGLGNRLLGYALAGGSIVFLLGTGSKTPAALLPLVLAATAACHIVRGAIPRLLILFTPLVLLLTAAIGSVLSPAVKAVVSTFVQDMTFTGRTDIWEFTVDHIMRRPIQGWGFGAFWKTNATLYGSEGLTWVNQADQAHNGYLDVALLMGLPGLALLVLLFVVQPWRDFQRLARGRAPDTTTLFFIRVWLFVLFTGTFESVFYDGNSSLFFLLVIAVFGLRLLAEHGPAPERGEAPEEVRPPAGSRDAGAPLPR